MTILWYFANVYYKYRFQRFWNFMPVIIIIIIILRFTHQNNNFLIVSYSNSNDRFDPKLISVRILEHDRNSTTEAKTQEFRVDKVIKHSGYSTYNYNNDIALIKLKDAIRFEGKMRPVCLPERGKRSKFSNIR